MSKEMDTKQNVKKPSMTHCFIPGCPAIAEWNKLLFFKMSFGDLPHWWKSTSWVAKHNTELPRDAVICERHFEERFIDRTRKKPRLMVGTVPTLNLASLEVDMTGSLVFFCRLCSKKGFTPMQYSLEQLGAMSEVVQCCLGRYRTEAALPPGVCESCVLMVKKFTQFVRQCEESQRQMLLLLKQEEGLGTMAECTNVEEEEANKENTGSEELANHVEDNKDQSLIKSNGNGPLKRKRNRYFDNGRACPDCGKLFMTHSTYYYHVQGHSEQDQFCQICDKKFARKNFLRKHLNLVHGGDKHQKHKCAHCGIAFSTRAQLEHHRTEDHKAEERKSRLKAKNIRSRKTKKRPAKKVKSSTRVE